jgi:hypothetical protein
MRGRAVMTLAVQALSSLKMGCKNGAHDNSQAQKGDKTKKCGRVAEYAVWKRVLPLLNGKMTR